MHPLPTLNCSVCGHGFYAACLGTHVEGSAPVHVCSVCMAMDAQPMSVILMHGDNPRNVTRYVHFDREKDSYFLGDVLQMIRSVSGKTWTRRGDVTSRAKGAF